MIKKILPIIIVLLGVNVLCMAFPPWCVTVAQKKSNLLTRIEELTLSSGTEESVFASIAAAIHEADEKSLDIYDVYVSKLELATNENVYAIYAGYFCYFLAAGCAFTAIKDIDHLLGICAFAKNELCAFSSSEVSGLNSLAKIFLTGFLVYVGKNMPTLLAKIRPE